ncbi:hypothetical protein EI94DRAFT_1733642 [Lactarius quietus]|nr:hypothetical protein EI94DRAFT_1733642 [Lactarius quietus]
MYKVFPGIWDHRVHGCIHRRHIFLRLHNHDARVSSEHRLEVPSTALLPLPSVLSVRLQDLADHPVCFSDTKVSATIAPEVASPRFPAYLKKWYWNIYTITERCFIHIVTTPSLHDLIRTAIKVGPTYIKRKHPPGQTVRGENYSASRYKNLGSLGCSAPPGSLYCLNLPLSFFLYG